MAQYATEDCMTACRVGDRLQVFGFESLTVLEMKSDTVEASIQPVEEPDGSSVTEATFVPLHETKLELWVRGVPAPNSALYVGEGESVITSFSVVLTTTQSGWLVDRFETG